MVIFSNYAIGGNRYRSMVIFNHPYSMSPYEIFKYEIGDCIGSCSPDR